MHVPSNCAFQTRMPLFNKHKMVFRGRRRAHAPKFSRAQGSEPESVSMAGSMPFGVLVPIHMADHNGSFTAKPGAYFCSDPEIKVRAKLL